MLALAVVVALAAEGPAPAERCVEAHTQAQLERKAAHLLASRQQLHACADSACPRPIREECTRWLDELTQEIPTVVVAARGPDGADVDASLAIDGTVRMTALDGKPFELDPGDHTFQCRSANVSVTVAALVSAGEHQRLISCAFAPVSVAVTPPPATDGEVVETPVRKRSRWPELVLVGAGVIGVGISSAFYVLGVQEDHRMRLECAPGCSQARVDGLRGLLAGGDAAAALALVSFAAAALLWLLVQSK